MIMNNDLRVILKFQVTSERGVCESVYLQDYKKITIYEGKVT